MHIQLIVQIISYAQMQEGGQSKCTQMCVGAYNQVVFYKDKSMEFDFGVLDKGR